MHKRRGCDIRRNETVCWPDQGESLYRLSLEFAWRLVYSMVYTKDTSMPKPARTRKRSAASAMVNLDRPGLVAEPASTHQAAEPAPARAKLFANGRSQAVRLPKEFRMPGSEVMVRRDGDRVILEPLRDEAVDALGWPIGFFDKLRADAVHLEVPDIEPLPVHFLEPEEIDPTVDWRT
jgi:antitoxin VapB